MRISRVSQIGASIAALILAAMSGFILGTISNPADDVTGSADRKSARLERELRQARAAEQSSLTLLETRTADFNKAMLEAEGRIQDVRLSLGSLPVYPWWPPQEPSTRSPLTSLLDNWIGLSLYDVGRTLATALATCGYGDYKFYAVPGGFILVTRIEAIDQKGAALSGESRFVISHDPNDKDLLAAVMRLFLEAPPGYYRFVAFVVTDLPIEFSREKLADTTAQESMRGGSTALPVSYQDRPLTSKHKLEALVYEYVKDGSKSDVRPLVPGRLAADDHLMAAGVKQIVQLRFASLPSRAN